MKADAKPVLWISTLCYVLLDYSEITRNVVLNFLTYKAAGVEQSIRCLRIFICEHDKIYTRINWECSSETSFAVRRQNVTTQNYLFPSFRGLEPLDKDLKTILKIWLDRAEQPFSKNMAKSILIQLGIFIGGRIMVISRTVFVIKLQKLVWDIAINL